MKKKTRLFNLLIIAAIFLGACNLPSNNIEDAAGTAAAQTVQALLISATSISSVDNTPSFTPLPPPTSSCNVMQFITDVTIPDGTIMTPGQTFTKTWRLKNVGTCAWTPSYAIAFSDGNAMNGPSTQAMVGTVNPGQTIDISVNLTAPASIGDYTGNWKLRDGSGVLFGKFYVQIKVQNPPATTSHTVNLSYMSAESGLVLNDGSLNTLTVAAGDSPGNLGVEAFLSFDISGVPSGSTIQNASILLKGGSQVRADPFATLGCLRAYVQNYGVVDASDFVPAGAVGAITRWCNTAELEAPYSDAGFITAVQGAVGSSRFQIRLQFKDTLTDGDGTIDDVLILAPVTLTITYSP